MASNYQLPLAGLLLVAQIILCLVLVQAQNTNFSFSSFNSTDSFLAVGDSRYDVFTSSYVMNELGYDNFNPTCGRLLYGEKVRMKDPVSGVVASFNTTFTFQITADPDHCQVKRNGDGLAFTFFRSINFADESTGGALCLLNETDNGMRSNRLFAVEFDTFLNPEYNDPSNNHIGVNINSMNSIPPIHNMCGTWEINCMYFCNGGNFTAWIDYDSASQVIQVFFVNSSLNNNNNKVSKPPTPVIQTFLASPVVVPLVDLLDEYMYVGFSASTGAYAEVNHIQSWTFLSSMPEQPPSPAPNVMPEQPPSRAPNVLTNSSSSHKRKVGIIVGICAGAVVVLLVLGFSIVRYRRRLLYYRRQEECVLVVDVDIVRDENSHAGDLDEDDPNDFNGFDTDAVEDPGGTIELGSSSDNQANLNVFVNTTCNIPNRGGAVQAFGRGVQYSGRGCLPSRSSPCVPLPPPTGHGHGSVTHVRNGTFRLPRSQPTQRQPTPSANRQHVTGVHGQGKNLEFIPLGRNNTCGSQAFGSGRAGERNNLFPGRGPGRGLMHGAFGAPRPGRGSTLAEGRGASDVNNVVPVNNVPAAAVTDSAVAVTDSAAPVTDSAAAPTTSVTRGLTSLQALFGGNFSENKGNFNINVHYYNH